MLLFSSRNIFRFKLIERGFFWGGLFVLCSRALASPYDYSYGSMARYEEMSRQNSFDRYMSSGSSKYGSSTDFAASFKQIFEQHFPPKRTAAPPLPQGNDRWDDYWRNYRAPEYTAPVVDNRTPQQRLIDSAQGGDTTAMYNLALCYLEGAEGFPKSATNASAGIYWLKTACEHGKAEAGTLLYTYLNPDNKDVGSGFVQKDAMAALYWLQKASAAGDGEAMCKLGDLTLVGAGVDANPTEGIRLLEASYKAGYKLALSALVGTYEFGVGVPKDLSKAIMWQREKVRIDLGFYAKPDLVRFLIADNTPPAPNPNDTPKPVNEKPSPHAAEIMQLFDSAPKQTSMLLLRAKVVDTVLLGPPDPAQSVAICQRLIDDKTTNLGKYEMAEAKYLLAEHLYEGRGIAKDEIAAYHLYRETMAMPDPIVPAKSGFYFATLLGGRLKHNNDDGTSNIIEDPEIALPLLDKAIKSEDLPKPMRAQAALLAARMLGAHPENRAAFKGDPAELLDKAQSLDESTMLGVALGLRLGWFGEVDKPRSRQVAQQAVNFNHNEALIPLVNWEIEDSDGQDPDWKTNIENGILYKSWDAYWWLADQLVSGTRLPKDLKRAESLLRTAATEGNNAKAQNNLGALLWRGEFGKGKELEGLTFMEKALTNGLWVSGRNLAKIYHLGLGVPKDEAKAKAFLEKAGQIGGADAASTLADAYEKGDIINADPVAAARWKDATKG